MKESTQMDLSQNTIQQAVDIVMEGRRSIRAFLDKPVLRSEIEDILHISARAPSGTNTQPWKVYVVMGNKKVELGQKILHAFLDPQASQKYHPEYAYYPSEWVNPFLARRRKVGFDLYALLGLGKEDKLGMQAQHGRNFTFFDAPVGIFFTINKVMGLGSWLDYGMFLQNVMLAARARGLDTCAQAAFTQFHQIIRQDLGIPDDEQLICGMSLGYEDRSKIENTLVTEREPVSNFASFIE